MAGRRRHPSAAAAAQASTSTRHRRLLSATPLLLAAAAAAAAALALLQPSHAASTAAFQPLPPFGPASSRRRGDRSYVLPRLPARSSGGGGGGSSRGRDGGNDDWDTGRSRSKPSRGSSSGSEDARGQGLFRALSALTGRKGPAGGGGGGSSSSKGGGKGGGAAAAGQPANKARAGSKPPPKKAGSTATSDGMGTGSVRLNKLLAHTGAAPSRRAAEAMIGEGRVSVNGGVVKDVGHKIDPREDKVVVNGKPVVVTAPKQAKDSVWVKLHKPKGALAALTDARGRKCLGDLVPDAREKGLLPVGRLGRESAGLLLLTDDREGAHLLADRAVGLVRVYKVVVEKGMPSPQALAILAKGIELEATVADDEDEEDERGRGGGRGRGGRGPPRPEKVQKGRKEVLPPMTVQCVDYFADRKEAVLEVTVREGRDRLLRQAFTQLGHPVKSVSRLAFGPIELGNLRAGESRRVSLAEVARLRGMLTAYRRKAARKGRRGGEQRGRRGDSGGKGDEEEEGIEVDPDIEAFWDAVEDEDDREEDGIYYGDDDF